MATSTSSRNSAYSQTAASSPDTNYSENEHDNDGILSAYQNQKHAVQTQSPEQLQPVAFNLDEIPLWKSRSRTLTLNSKEHFLVAAKQHREVHHHLEIQRSRSESVTSEDSHATLAEEEERAEEREMEMDLKTPTVHRMKFPDADEVGLATAGPMSQLLHSLLLRVADAERAQPTVMAEDYKGLQSRMAEVERENQTILKSHNDLLALRNDDLTNLIKVRGLLAEERREHTAMRKLRDDDLENVLMLRDKLAKATWSGKMQVSTPQPERRSYLSGSMTPTQPHPFRISRSDSDDLWKQAKTAAMEQRILELEKANAELRAAQSASAQTVASTGSSDNLLNRVEGMFEDSLRQREKMATRVQQLRSEKDVLQKEVAGLEDRNSDLEAMVERMKRNTSVGVVH